MANFSLEIGGALSTAWEYAKKYGLLIAVVYLLVGILTNGLQSIGAMFGGILSTIVSVGLYNQALGVMSGRFNEVTFDAFKLPFATYLKVFVVSFIVGIISIVAFFCCVIPALFVVPRLILAPVYQVEHPEAGIFESIGAAWNMTSDNTFSMLGLGIVIFGIIILGFCCCCIGVYFAQAIELFALIAAYNQLKGNLQ